MVVPRRRAAGSGKGCVMLRMLVTAAVAALVLSAWIGAGQAQHGDKERPCTVKGTIVKVEPVFEITVKDSAGKLKCVICHSKCKIQHGTHQLTCKDLKANMKVTVKG